MNDGKILSNRNKSSGVKSNVKRSDEKNCNYCLTKLDSDVKDGLCNLCEQII